MCQSISSSPTVIIHGSRDQIAGCSSLNHLVYIVYDRANNLRPLYWPWFSFSDWGGVSINQATETYEYAPQIHLFCMEKNKNHAIDKEVKFSLDKVVDGKVVRMIRSF